MSERVLAVAGVATRIREAGAAGPLVVLVPPGLYGAGTLEGLVAPSLRLWDPVIDLLAGTHRVVALDTLGSGRTGAGAEPPAFGAALAHLRAAVAALGGHAHLVGHDEGGLLALRLALDAPGEVASLTVVSSPSAAPTGDGLNPVLLAAPLRPLLSRAGQRWALERASHAPHHVTPDLLDELVALAGEASPPDAAAAPGLARSLAKAKGASFADLRDTGLAVPGNVVWGRDDPVCPPAHGRELFEMIARRQRVAELHLLNRAGYFAYREQPAAFAAVVAGFVRGLEG